MFALIVVAVLAFSCNGVCTRFFQTRKSFSSVPLQLFQTIFCIISAICFFIAGLFFEGFALPSFETVFWGACFGILFWLATAMAAKCYDIGSMAVTSTIINLSLILPIVYSIIFFDEKLTPIHIVGFVFFLISLVFSADFGGSEKKGNILWFILVLIGFVGNGSTAIIQKNYALNSASGQDRLFLSVAYAVAALIFFVHFIIRLEKKKTDSKSIPPARVSASLVFKLLGLSALAGIGSFGGNLLLGYLSANVDSAVLYPCINGGLIVVVALCSFVFFRERLTWRKLVAILVGCVSILILNM